MRRLPPLLPLLDIASLSLPLSVCVFEFFHFLTQPALLRERALPQTQAILLCAQRFARCSLSRANHPPEFENSFTWQVYMGWLSEICWPRGGIWPALIPPAPYLLSGFSRSDFPTPAIRNRWPLKPPSAHRSFYSSPMGDLNTPWLWQTWNYSILSSCNVTAKLRETTNHYLVRYVWGQPASDRPLSLTVCSWQEHQMDFGLCVLLISFYFSVQSLHPSGW